MDFEKMLTEAGFTKGAEGGFTKGNTVAQMTESKVVIGEKTFDLSLAEDVEAFQTFLKEELGVEDVEVVDDEGKSAEDVEKEEDSEDEDATEVEPELKDGSDDEQVVGTKVEDDEDAEDDEEEVIKESVITADVKSIFEGVPGLSEDFYKKASVVYRATLLTQLQSTRKALNEAKDIQVEAEVTQRETKLVEHIDQYLELIAKEWLEENRVAVETGIRQSLTESFIDSLKKLFESHYIEVPTAKGKILDELADTAEAFEQKVKLQESEISKLKSQLDKKEKDCLILEATVGLPDSKVAKFKDMAQTLPFNTNFKGNLKIIRESVEKGGNTKNKLVESLTESAIIDSKTPVKSGPTEVTPMDAYVKALTKKS